jgi:hypothetical protein
MLRKQKSPTKNKEVEVSLVKSEGHFQSQIIESNSFCSINNLSDGNSNRNIIEPSN